MFKLFEWIGSIIAIACLIEIASNPKQVVRDIQNGPAPHLREFNDRLNGLHYKSERFKRVNGRH